MSIILYSTCRKCIYYRLLFFLDVTQGLAKEGLFEDLKLEMKRRRDAEEMSLKARKQVEELEAKVAYMEKQLEERERLERQMSMVRTILQCDAVQSNAYYTCITL